MKQYFTLFIKIYIITCLTLVPKTSGEIIINHFNIYYTHLKYIIMATTQLYTLNNAGLF